MMQADRNSECEVRQMTLTQITYFLKTAEHCNFTKAAAELYITQQVLSRQIQALEKEIGFSLFHRENRRHVELTEEGTLMYGVWKPLVEQTQIALRQARSMLDKLTIRVGIPDIGRVLDLVMGVMQQYMLEQDTVEVELIVESSNKIRWMFEQSQLDMMIVFSVNTAELQKAFPNGRLQKMEFGVICSKNHPLASKKLIHAEDLIDQTLCMFDESYAKNIEADVLSIYRNAGILPKTLKRYDNWQNMSLALELGSGLNLGFRSFIKEEKGLVYIPLERRLWNESIWLMAFYNEKVPEELLERLKKVF